MAMKQKAGWKNQGKSFFKRLIVRSGEWFFDTSETFTLMLPESVKPKAEKLVKKARRQAKKALDKGSLTRVFLENLGYRTTLNLISKVVMFFIILWLTRVLSPKDFGLYSFTISTAQLFAVFGGLGITGALLKKIPELIFKNKKKEASQWVLGGLLLLSMGALSLFIFMFLASPWLATHLFHKQFTRGAIKLAGGFLFLYLTAAFFDNLFAALKRNDLSLKVGLSREVVKLLAIVSLVILGYGYVGAVYGYMLGIFAFLVVGSIIALKNYGYLFEGKPGSPSGILSYSKWFLALGITGTILSMTDMFMIPIFMPIDYAGYYKVAVSLISTIMYLLPIGMITMPIFSESKSKDELDKKFKRIFKPVMWLTFGLALLVVLIGKPLMALLYPRDYVTHAWLPLIVLAFLIPARNAFWLNAQKLIVLGKEREQLLITALAAGLNVVLNALLIPWLGLVGAALASVGSLVVGVAITFML